MAEFGRKAAKMMMMGKGYSMAEYEADAVRLDAARLLADEDALEAAKTEASNTFLYEAITADLRRELEITKAKLMQHTSSREVALQTEVAELRAEKRALEARLHWESNYGLFLGGAFLLANDGECECTREFRLYRGDAAAGGGAGGADPRPAGDGAAARGTSRKSRACRRDGSGRFVRSCSCGREY